MSTICCIKEVNVERHAGLCNEKVLEALKSIELLHPGCFFCAQIQALGQCEQEEQGKENASASSKIIQYRQLGLSCYSGKKNKLKNATHAVLVHAPQAQKEENWIIFDPTYIPEASPDGPIESPHFYKLYDYLYELEKVYDGEVISWRMSWKPHPNHFVEHEGYIFIDV